MKETGGRRVSGREFLQRTSQVVGAGAIAGMTPVDRLLSDFRIIASVTPYAFQLPRIGTSIVNTPAEVDQAVAAIASLT